MDVSRRDLIKLGSTAAAASRGQGGEAAGVIFDVGHGGGGFDYTVCATAYSFLLAFG